MSVLEDLIRRSDELVGKAHPPRVIPKTAA